MTAVTVLHDERRLQTRSGTGDAEGEVQIPALVACKTLVIYNAITVVYNSTNQGYNHKKNGVSFKDQTPSRRRSRALAEAAVYGLIQRRMARVDGSYIPSGIKDLRSYLTSES